MSLGYLYILSNKSMPGLLKIGRTDRRPETRAKELTSATGVPLAFEIEFSVLVYDSIAAERFVHGSLEAKGLRFSLNREFFRVSLEEATELLRQSSIQAFSVEDYEKSIFNQAYLRNRYEAIQFPSHYQKISQIRANELEKLLWPIAREGLTHAYMRLAHIFLENFPDQLKYRQHLLDYLDSRFAEVKQDWSTTSMQIRQEVGKEVANFLENLHLKGWFGKHDFDTVKNFLLSADGYTYEGYVQQVKRSEFPSAIRSEALDL